MALISSSSGIILLVAIPASGTKYPELKTPTNEDLNKFNFAKARSFSYYNEAGATWSVLLVDFTSYYS
jgi:hypothetical protein